MRPEIRKPDLQSIVLKLNVALVRLRDDDPEFQDRIRCIRWFLTDLYESVVWKGTHDWNHRDWAWCMRVMVEKCLKDIMTLDLNEIVFDLVKTCFLGYVGAPVPPDRIAKYNKTKPKFKDVYEITVEYFGKFDFSEQELEAFCNKHSATSALLYLTGRYVPTTELDGLRQHYPEMEETLEAMTSFVWERARAAYFQLQKDGYNVLSLDEVFEPNRTSRPFKDSVFMSLAMSFFRSCGWIPVQYTGLFSAENMKLENRAKNKLLDKLYLLVRSHGHPKGSWDSWWGSLSPQNKDTANLTMVMMGPYLLPSSGKVHKYVDKLKEIFPETKKYDSNPRAAEIVGKYFQKGQILYPSLFKFYEEHARFKKHNPEFVRPAGVSDVYEGVGDNDIHDLVDKCMNLTIQNPEPGQDEGYYSGVINDLPFQEILEHLQLSKEYLLFKGMFTACNERFRISYGVFLQQCLDYANDHDPSIWYDNDPDWVTWNVFEHHPSNINIVTDTSLFVDGLVICKPELAIVAPDNTVLDRCGRILLAYDSEGKPIYRTAYHSGSLRMSGNLLCLDDWSLLINSTCYLTFDYEVQLRRLKEIEKMGGEKALTWRGQELTNIDFKYWHERLGHLGIRKMKRYTKMIKGLPPYFFNARIDCQDCI